MPTVYPLAPDVAIQYTDSNGDLASGFQLFVYEAGTTTKATSYQTSAGSSANSNPVVLNSRGETPYGVYVETGSYKLVLAPDTDTDPPTSAIWTRDNLTPSNDVANATADEWTSPGFTPTYIDGTNFSVSGDRTSTFTVGRRVKITDSGGTDYGTITASSFGSSITTVTVSVDSGSIDSGISAVDVGILDPANSSLFYATADGDGVNFSGTLSVTGAVDLGSTLQLNGISTRGDIPVVGASSVLTQLAMGSAGQVVSTDGTDTVWALPDSWAHQSTATPSAAAAVEFTDLDQTSDHLFVFRDLLPATDSSHLYAETSPDAGGSPTYDTGASDYAYVAFGQNTGSTSTTVNNDRSSGAAFMDLDSSQTGNVGANEEGVSAEFILYNPGASKQTWIRGLCSSYNASGNPNLSVTHACRKASAAVQAIKFYFSAGNITSGEIAHYTRPKQ